MEKSLRRWIGCILLIATLLGMIGCGGRTQGTQQPEQPKGAQEQPQKAAADRKTLYAEVWKKSVDKDGYDLPRPEKISKKWHIGVVLPQLSVPHFISMAYGVYDEAEKTGTRVTVYEAGGYQYVDRQVKQLEDLMAAGVDGVMLVAVDAQGTKAVVDKAADEGIPIANVNVLTASDKVVTRIRSDDLDIGKKQAEAMAKALKGKGNVVLLCGPAGASWAINRSKGFEDLVKEKYPEIKILDKKWFPSDPASGMKEMEDVLQAYPNVDGVFTGGEVLGLGVAQAIKAAGKSGKIIMTSADGQKPVWALIKEGVVTATVAQSPVIMGRYGIRAVIYALEGKADQLCKRYWSPIKVVDQSNIDKEDLHELSWPPEGWQVPK